MNILTITDETAVGKILQKISLEFETEYVSVKELIAARIKSEIARYEQSLDNYKNGLVLPTNLEKRLNKQKSPRIDPEKQLYIALEAFQNNGFFILIDDEQLDRLEQKFLVDESTQVTFIKLTPLVGG